MNANNRGRLCRSSPAVFANVAALISALFIARGLASAADVPSIFDAVRSGDAEAVKRILETDAKAVKATNENGDTPLHVLTAQISVGIGFDGSASRVQSLSPVAAVLVAKGADLNAKNKLGYTPLLCAIGRDQIPLAKFLVEKGCDVNCTIDVPGRNKGLTPLHAAVGTGYTEMVDLLAGKGAKVNAQMDDGNSPLHIAAIYNYPKAAKVLLQHNADLQLRNQKGQTPLAAAQAAGNQAVVEILRAARPAQVEAGEATRGPQQPPTDARFFHAGKVRLTIQDTRLGEARPGADSRSLVLSPDRRHVAYVVRQGDSQFVVLDDNAHAPYRAIGIGSVIFSANGKSVAYVALQGTETLAVLNGKEHARYADIGDRSIVLSQDGRRVAYAAKRAAGQWLVRVDNVETETYDEIGTVLFSPNGRRVAYAAKADGQWYVVVDSKKSKAYDGVAKICFSPDSERVGYIAWKGATRLVVINNEQVGQFSEVGAEGLVFSPDSKRFALAATLNNRQTAVIDGTPTGFFDKCDNIVFSPDSQHVAFRSAQAGKQLVVVDTKHSKEYEGVGTNTILFSPDGSRLAFGAVVGRNKQVVVLDSAEGASYEGVGSRMVFSPDSRHLACVVSQNGGTRRSVVIDGIEGKGYAGLQENTLAFSPDGMYLAYWAGDGSGQFVVVNGSEAGRYDGFLRGGTLVFDSPTKLHALALRGGTFYCVEVEVAPQR